MNRFPLADRLRAHITPGGENLMPLPSSESAKAFALGQKGATLTIALHTIGRAALIAPGLYVAGRAFGSVDTKEALLIKALGAAMALELFAIVWFTSQVRAIEVPARKAA